jgi:hypothetical protein
MNNSTQNDKQYEEEERNTPLYNSTMNDENQGSDPRFNDLQGRRENENDFENDDLNNDLDRDYDENRSDEGSFDPIDEDELEGNSETLQNRDSIFDQNDSSKNNILKRDNIHENDDIDPYFQKNSSIAKDLDEELKDNPDKNNRDEYSINKPGTKGNE